MLQQGHGTSYNFIFKQRLSHKHSDFLRGKKLDEENNKKKQQITIQYLALISRTHKEHSVNQNRKEVVLSSLYKKLK